MSTAFALAHARSAPAPAGASAFAPVARPLVLRRKCACGGGSDAGGECEECARKKPGTLRRSALAVGEPGDRFEQEAERIAGSVVRGGGAGAAQPSAGAVSVQREGGGGASSGPSAPPIVHEVLGSPGQPLDGGTRVFMEQRFGHDFGRVRVHADARAAESARAVGARAWTVGNDVAFGAGAWAPSTTEGRRLLAHELTHVLQQGDGVVRRACDPALLASRTEPVFFPKQTKLMAVFGGADTLKKNDADAEAVGLVQQALTDLCHPGGIWGPNKDGVDRKFGGDTTDSVKAFQVAQGLTGSGEVDQDTFRCLDEARSRRTLPCKTGRALKESDLQADREKTGGRDEDIFFGRGDKTLDAGDLIKVQALAAKFKDKALTLSGFQSEDEVVDLGPGLAKERIDAVEAELAGAGHAKARTPDAQPRASGGVLDYPERRKVEVVPAGAAKATPGCTTIPAGWTLPDQGPCPTPVETEVLKDIDRGVKLMDDAIKALVPGDAAADKAVADRFGDKRHLPTIKAKLTTWRNHLDTFVRANHTCTNACHGACAGVNAYVRGATKVTFLCPALLGRPAAERDRRALIILHEAGHGALDTTDIAYDTTRLLAVIHKTFSAAQINTDSFILLVQCLNGITIDGLGCTVPASGDTFPGLSATRQGLAEDALAWHERWMDFAWQSFVNLYPAMDRARKAGAWLPGDATKRWIMARVSEHFGLRRPEGDPPPTFREQTAVAALHDHFRVMRVSSLKRFAREMTQSATTAPEWVDSHPAHRVVVPPTFFTSMGRRERVRFLVKLMAQAQPGVSPAAVPAYVEYTDEMAKLFTDQPK